VNVALKLLLIKRPIDEHPEVAKLWAALTLREQIQQRSHTLLQEHMQCGVAIAKLEAQRAEYLAFMERFRSSLKQEEYDQKEEPVCVELTFQEEPMSQDHYRDLIERIGRHCQQTAWDAQHLERKQRWLIEPGEDYDGWYLPVRNSFIALKKGTHAWEPSLAFPPATEHQFRETEQELGFSLPALLRLCYTQIANGGFGPGYGIIGVLGGFPLMDGFGEDIAQGYQQCLHASTPIRLEEYEMITWAQWAKQQANSLTMIWKKKPSYEQHATTKRIQTGNAFFSTNFLLESGLNTFSRYATGVAASARVSTRALSIFSNVPEVVKGTFSDMLRLHWRNGGALASGRGSPVFVADYHSATTCAYLFKTDALLEHAAARKEENRIWGHLLEVNQRASASA